MKKILNSLSEDEYVLILETKKRQLAELDEDDLIALHTRVRQARNKYTKNYRRAGSVKVGEKKARGAGKAANVRNAGKAEVFEGALSRVSRRLATVSRQSARDLKEERLQRARNGAPSFSDIDTSKGKVPTSGKARVDETRNSPGRKKFEASSIAAGARRQAKKDKRR
ncbi:hypothetical protein R3Q06_30450 [Rhodococcus erythropolis]|uniref:hypothetical protein n=1 Tax=Rhodococcus erythropolis TaxID=1833 RepID=UPI00294A98B4|nr:hypothetical protein [Rhodococcus erythropolis]MDV6277818.1 hypothetical protein [Rhodococcus erythropolis]